MWQPAAYLWPCTLVTDVRIPLPGVECGRWERWESDIAISSRSGVPLWMARHAVAVRHAQQDAQQAGWRLQVGMVGSRGSRVLHYPALPLKGHPQVNFGQGCMSDGGMAK